MIGARRTSCGCGVTETCDRYLDECDCIREVTEHQLRIDAEDLTAATDERAVATRVSAATQTMVRAVHFDDEPEGWREEVDDGVAEDNLPAEGDAELRAGESGPEETFGFAGGATCPAARDASR